MVVTATKSADLASSLRKFIEASVTGDSETVGALVSETVYGWSPTLAVFSRDELLNAFDERVGALEDIEMAIHTVDVIGSKAISEWRLTAYFRGELVLDGVTIPPTGRLVCLAGATFAEFDDDGLMRSFRHYFDDAALLEQLLAAS